MPNPESPHMPSIADRPDLDLTLVIDIGKSNAKWLMLDAYGQVVARDSRANASVRSPLGYPALDVEGLAAWLQHSVRASAHAARCGHVIASTHGAALVALGEAAMDPIASTAPEFPGLNALAWAPLDYEFAAIDSPASASSFRQTLSPDLPAGLNAGRQLDWLQNQHPEAWRQTRCLLPYAQFWAWLLSGVASSEVSSLGCHTHLWNPLAAQFSDWAVARGWAALFAPLRQAWEILGPVTPSVSEAWGLPAQCLVHVGVHDSNACLVRYLESKSDRRTSPLTVVSSGTWTVLMAPGAGTAQLDAAKDMLGNVDVTGRVTPTARFMGGREFSVLLDGAVPDHAALSALPDLLQTRTYAVPSFAAEGGPFAARAGWVERGGQVLAAPLARHLTAAQRATLAALYCAQVTAWLTGFLWADRATGIGQAASNGRLIVEGPLAHNPVFLALLQSLLPSTDCFASTDAVEGTARGAWLLSQWAVNGPNATRSLPEAVAGMSLAPVTAKVDSALEPALAAYHAEWLTRLAPNNPQG